MKLSLSCHVKSSPVTKQKTNKDFVNTLHSAPSTKLASILSSLSPLPLPFSSLDSIHLYTQPFPPSTHSRLTWYHHLNQFVQVPCTHPPWIHKINERAGQYNYTHMKSSAVRRASNRYFSCLIWSKADPKPKLKETVKKKSPLMQSHWTICSSSLPIQSLV